MLHMNKGANHNYTLNSDMCVPSHSLLYECLVMELSYAVSHSALLGTLPSMKHEC